MSYSLDFIIRKDKLNSDKECPICLRYTFNRKNYKIPLGESVKIEQWDGLSRLPFTNVPKFRTIYNNMLNLEDRVRKLISQFNIENIRYPESLELKNLLNQKELNISAPSSHKFVRDVFTDFISFSEKERVVQKPTIIVYKTTLKKWIQYETESGKKLRLIDISFKTLDDFKWHLKSKNLMYSSVGKSIKTIKTLLNSYVIKREKINIDLSFKEVEVEEAVENNFQYLNEKEFEILKQAVFYSQYDVVDKDISLTSAEKNIGRMFLFMCSTGLCYIDLMNLTYFNICIEEEDLKFKDSTTKQKEFIYLKLTRQKTKHLSECIVPILGLTIELLISILGKPIEYAGAYIAQIPNSARIKILKSTLVRKKGFDKEKSLNDYFIFKRISNQVFNREIKRLFDKLEFHETVPVRKNRNDNTIEIKRKCDLISSHTGRRTYITLCLEKGIRPDQLMRTTGHKKFETMKKYVKYYPQSIKEEFESKLSK
jgi:site-specific recombinase XerD